MHICTHPVLQYIFLRNDYELQFKLHLYCRGTEGYVMIMLCAYIVTWPLMYPVFKSLCLR